MSRPGPSRRCCHTRHSCFDSLASRHTARHNRSLCSGIGSCLGHRPCRLRRPGHKRRSSRCSSTRRRRPQHKQPSAPGRRKSYSRRPCPPGTGDHRRTPGGAVCRKSGEAKRTPPTTETHVVSIHEYALCTPASPFQKTFLLCGEPTAPLHFQIIPHPPGSSNDSCTVLFVSPALALCLGSFGCAPEDSHLRCRRQKRTGMPPLRNVQRASACSCGCWGVMRSGRIKPRSQGAGSWAKRAISSWWACWALSSLRRSP